LGWTDAKNDPGCGGVKVITYAPAATVAMEMMVAAPASTDCRTDKTSTPISINFTNSAPDNAKIRGCQNQYACKPYVDCELALAPHASELVTIDASFKYMVFTFHGKSSEAELYPDANLKWPSSYDIEEPTVMALAAPAPSPLVKHLEDPDHTHCSDITVEFDKESNLDQVDEWWSANEYKYTSWANGSCPTKFNTVDHLEHPIGVKGITTREKGLTATLLAAVTTKCNSADTIKACDAMPGCIWSHFGCVANSSSPVQMMMMAEVQAEDKYFHGVSDNKCREAMWKMDGVETPGQCPAEFDERESQEVSTVCRTGGNLKYCPAGDVMNVTVTTWGESGWMHNIENNHCVEANFTLPGVNMTGRCPTQQYKVVQSDDVTTVCRNGGNLKYCAARDVIVVEVVTRGD
jgi:hypothetical protein